MLVLAPGAHSRVAVSARPEHWKGFQTSRPHHMDRKKLFIDCYEMTLVKGKIACQKQIFEQGHVRRAETIRIPALATLLYVDWLPQVNGPPGALLSSVVDHESAIIVNT